jgi:hypothetical protein
MTCIVKPIAHRTLGHVFIPISNTRVWKPPRGPSLLNAHLSALKEMSISLVAIPCMVTVASALVRNIILSASSSFLLWRATEAPPSCPCECSSQSRINAGFYIEKAQIMSFLHRMRVSINLAFIATENSCMNTYRCRVGNSDFIRLFWFQPSQSISEYMDRLQTEVSINLWL